MPRYHHIASLRRAAKLRVEVFERMAGLYAMLAAGVTIAYAENMETVGADAVAVRPTVMTGVPRFYEKVYARVMETAAALAEELRLMAGWLGLAAVEAGQTGNLARALKAAL